MNEIQTFRQQLIADVRTPGAGARLQSSSSRSSAVSGNGGGLGNAVTRPGPDGETLEEWLWGDPWEPGYYFKEWRNNNA